MNAELLKKALLQWAIEGKLVPQSDDEEGVGNIGGIPENIPFAIPKKWKWVKLGQVFALKAGKFISSSEIKASGEYPCYGGNGVRGFLDRYNREGRFPLIGRQGALCGNINLADGKFYATEHAVVADGGDRIDPDCAAFFLTALNLNQYATHTAQPGLSVKRISETPFPVPPFKEQLRISQKLNEILPLVEAYGKEQEALLKLERELPGKLRASILQEAIQGKLVPQLDDEPEVKQIGETPEEVPFSIPEKWKWIQLNIFSEKRKNIEPDDMVEEVELWSIPSYDKGVPDRVNAKCIKSSKKRVFCGDVLLSKIVPTIERAWVVSGDFPEKVASTEWIVFSGKNILDPEYMTLIFKSPAFRKEMLSTVSGMGSLKRASSKRIMEFFVPVPPIQEQKRILEKFNSLYSDIENLRH